MGILAAFAAVYLIWGSTYLAIRLALETMPPFLMAGVRFTVAGALLYAWARARGAQRPTAIHWRNTAVIGGLLLLGGNGAVVWSEQRISSGVASLLVATVPLWMVLLEAMRTRARPSRTTLAGVLLGLCGIAILVGPGALGDRVDPLGALAVVIGSLSWAIGSMFSRHTELPRSPFLATAMEMLCGGALLLLVGASVGEQVQVAAISLRSALALAYLTAFGSLVAFTAYIWLLRVSTPARVATYAYVNPVVAVLLGWAIAGEPLGARTLLAAAIIVGAVVLITSRRSR